jgi:hypothetical protein
MKLNDILNVIYLKLVTVMKPSLARVTLHGITGTIHAAVTTRPKRGPF